MSAHRPKRLATALAATSVLAAVMTVGGQGTASAASVATWDKVAFYESTNNWSINTGNGYYGGLQISLYNWQHYGGTQYAARPDLATKTQQILIAEKILADQGYKAWSCWEKAGLDKDQADPFPVSANTVRLVNLKPDHTLQNAEGDFSAGQWSSWSDMGANSVTEVTSAATGSVNRIFAIRDGQVYEKDGNYATGQWSGWFQPATGNLPGGATAVSASSIGNTVHLVAIGADGHLYNADGDFAAGRWTGWTDHGGNLKRVTSATTSDNVNHIFATSATNGQVLELDANYATGTWSSWSNAGSSAFTAQDVAASASGRTVHLSAVAPDGTWSNTDGDFATGQWNGWFKMPGSNLKRITSATANNVNHVFATDTANRLQEIDGDYNTGTWSSWAPAAGGTDSLSATAAFTG
ncbi:transglycosylase family protein [Kitasatospora sp. NPDC051853]|uniref:transglycosylase family protein n=1 Tax=Kitasatospora sp. NPDC051853 TaxID=3364058 RepID=UPI003793DBD5